MAEAEGKGKAVKRSEKRKGPTLFASSLSG
jgi:hypothetical protein